MGGWGSQISLGKLRMNREVLEIISYCRQGVSILFLCPNARLMNPPILANWVLMYPVPYPKYWGFAAFPACK